MGEKDVAVFDRGLKSRKTFKEFTENNILFVTRINPTKSIKVIKENALNRKQKTSSLLIESDEVVHLFYESKNKLKEPFRLIKAKSLETSEPLLFLTNIIGELSAAEITDIYKRRWEIEIFFKFAKQYLHLKHLFSYNSNGIQVMMYMSMITAMLLLMFKKKNKITSYKIAKFIFTEQLDIEIIKEIVVLCGGNPSKSPLLNSS